MDLLNLSSIFDLPLASLNTYSALKIKGIHRYQYTEEQHCGFLMAGSSRGAFGSTLMWRFNHVFATWISSCCMSPTSTYSSAPPELAVEPRDLPGGFPFGSPDLDGRSSKTARK